MGCRRGHSMSRAEAHVSAYVEHASDDQCQHQEHAWMECDGSAHFSADE